MAAKMAIIAITTKSSINVNPLLRHLRFARRNETDENP